MPQAVLIAALPSLIAGGSAVATSVMGAKAQSGASRRSIAATNAAAQRAEAFEREQDELNRAEQARRDAEDKRRYEIEQANLVRRQAQEDALLRDNIARANYEDAIRYGKMVNLARLTGQPAPERPPQRTSLDMLSGTPAAASARPSSAPLLSRPSTANASIAAPGAVVNPWEGLGVTPQSGVPQRMPISQLVGRRRVV